MKRPQVIRFAAFVTVLAVLLGYVVYHRNMPGTQALKPAASATSGQSTVLSLENYFVNYRMHRDQVMTEEIATLKSLMANPGIAASSKAEAASTIVRDTQELKQETRIEGLLSGRGFPLSAATVTPSQVVVMVAGSQLTEEQVARIADTATEVTGMPPQNVVILPKS